MPPTNPIGSLESERDVCEQREPSLDHLPMPGSHLVGFLALQASNGERKGPQPRFRDVSSALDTASVLAGFKPSQRGIDPLDRFMLDLNERELDVFLNVDISHFPFVESADRGRSSPLCSHL
jgi:hypothetical protein